MRFGAHFARHVPRLTWMGIGAPVRSGASGPWGSMAASPQVLMPKGAAFACKEVRSLSRLDSYWGAC